MKHFCTCPVEKCPKNPKNHEKGCSPCILDNLKKKKMPACFFGIVNEDMSDVTDYSIEGFVRYFHEHQTNSDMQ
nr:DUF6485 family protein [Clostridioides difficile]